MFLAEMVLFGRMIRQQHTSMDVAYYLLQALNHWCSSTGWSAHKLCRAVTAPQADCHIPWACVSPYPHLIKFIKMTFKKIWVAQSQQDPANNFCGCFCLSWCRKVNSAHAQQILICAAHTDVVKTKGEQRH